MILGYSSNAFVKYSLTDAIEKIAGLGFGGVEIMCDRPHLYPPDFERSGLEPVRRALESHRLKITNLNCFTLFAVGDTYLPSWIEPEEARREIRIRHTEQCLHIAKQLGASRISIPPGGPLNGMDRDRAVRLFHQGLERVIPLAEELGIRLLIEPEPELLIERTSEFKSFIDGVRSDAVGLNFDIGHFFCVGEDPAAAFEELFPWVGHVHIEDIASDRTHKHLIPGHGAIPFRSVFETMKRLGYAGDICLELYPYVETPENAGRESIDHLMPVFEAAGLHFE